MSSLPTRRKALGANGARPRPRAGSAKMSRRRAGAAKAMTRPPVTSAPVRRNSRRVGWMVALTRTSSRLGAGRAVHGGADPLVGAAAADVAAQGGVDVGVGGVGLGRQQCGRGHDLPRLAVAALDHVQLGPGPLHRVVAVGGQALDGGDLLALRRPTTGVTQARRGAPSRCTVQAPHCATPQPNLVPVRPSRSRRTQSSGMSGGAVTSRSVPLTVSFMAGPSRSGLVSGWL